MCAQQISGDGVSKRASSAGALFAAVALLAASGTIPVYAAEPAKSKFLQLSAEHRSMWLDGAIIATSHVVAMRDQQKGDCISAWWLDDTKGRQKLIEDTMAKYPQISSPTTVIIGLLGKACGPLAPAQR